MSISCVHFFSMLLFYLSFDWSKAKIGTENRSDDDVVPLNAIQFVDFRVLQLETNWFCLEIETICGNDRQLSLPFGIDRHEPHRRKCFYSRYLIASNLLVILMNLFFLVFHKAFGFNWNLTDRQMKNQSKGNRRFASERRHTVSLFTWSFFLSKNSENTTLIVLRRWKYAFHFNSIWEQKEVSRDSIVVASLKIVTKCRRFFLSFFFHSLISLFCFSPLEFCCDNWGFLYILSFTFVENSISWKMENFAMQNEELIHFADRSVFWNEFFFLFFFVCNIFFNYTFLFMYFFIN